jgi:hypothetical protein
VDAGPAEAGLRFEVREETVLMRSRCHGRKCIRRAVLGSILAFKTLDISREPSRENPMEKPAASTSLPGEPGDDLLRRADRLIDLSRRERERISASMADPSEEWKDASARLAEAARRASMAATKSAESDAGAGDSEAVPEEMAVGGAEF